MLALEISQPCSKQSTWSNLPSFAAWHHSNFNIIFLNRHISGMGGLINMEQKSIQDDVGPAMWSWTLTSPMTLTLDFEAQYLKKPYLRNGRANWHGVKGMWVDNLLDLLWHWTGPHTWLIFVFQGQIWKITISHKAFRYYFVVHSQSFLSFVICHSGKYSWGDVRNRITKVSQPCYSRLFNQPVSVIFVIVFLNVSSWLLNQCWRKSSEMSDNSDGSAQMSDERFHEFE